MKTCVCVSDEEMAQLIDGQLQEEVSASVTQHIDSCLECRVVFREATLLVEDLRLASIEPYIIAALTESASEWMETVLH